MSRVENLEVYNKLEDPSSYYTRENNLNESISILISPPANPAKIPIHTQQNAIATSSRSPRRLHDETWPIYRENAPPRPQPVQSFGFRRSLIKWTDMGFKKEWHGQLIWFTLVLLFFFCVLFFLPKGEGKEKYEERQRLAFICRELRRAEQKREERFGEIIVSDGKIMRIFPPDFTKNQGPLCVNED
ncbi:unnamed protein product, partial [Mesorhabditis belari]|uniref:Uncharacterized protein n=1 Tax=Mesorhabditis belari TaxID=2138241 RepID=A0AAF3J1Q7_9BILA